MLSHARHQQYSCAIGERHMLRTANTIMNIQPRCRCSMRPSHASTKFGVAGASRVKRPTIPHANHGVRCCPCPSQRCSIRSWAHHYTDKMPAAAIEEARESVLGVSLEYDRARLSLAPVALLLCQMMLPASGIGIWSSPRRRGGQPGSRHWHEV